MKLNKVSVGLLVLFSIFVASNAQYLSIIPEAIHCAFYTTSTQMTVSWLTQGKTATIVKYGTNSDELTMTATGIARNYLPGELPAGWNHHTVLSNLTLDTKYYYSVGNGEEMSEIAYFVTQPSALRPFHIPIYGDMGDKNSNWTRKFLENYLDDGGAVDFVYHIGDISYADDYNATRYDPIWNEWFFDMQGIMKRVPYMTCPGNHEADGGYAAKNFTAYQYRFMMPENPSAGNTNMFFSWNYYNIHFISVSTETDYPNAPEGYASFGPQLTWLEADLASVDRSQYPWIIIVGHRPLYSSSSTYANSTGFPIGQAAETQRAFEQLFHEYEVDLFFCGHVHSYERIYPTYENEVQAYPAWKLNDTDVFEDPNATIYVISGAAGCEESLSNLFNSSWVHPAPQWSADRYGSDFGLGILHIMNTTTLYWEFLKSDTGEVLDGFWLNKNTYEPYYLRDNDL